MTLSSSSFYGRPTVVVNGSGPAAQSSTGDLTVSLMQSALREVETWPGYAPTPMYDLRGVAVSAGVGRLWYKDEGHRFEVRSFKPLGAGYAVARVVSRVAQGAQVASTTVACATDGNHGRAVAWMAGRLGCRAVVYLASHVSDNRARAIASYGAHLVRTTGTHEDAVRQVALDARQNEWHIITQAEHASDPLVPRDIMSGYGSLMVESAAQLTEELPTHVFVPAGVGGLVAAVCAFCTEHWQGNAPRVISVEPVNAACVFHSVAAGQRVTVSGSLDTLMGGLAAGEVAPMAWNVLAPRVHACVTIGDHAAIAALQVLADGRYGDAPIRAGESGVAGLAGALSCAGDPPTRATLGLDEESRILAVGTEGVTDPAIYERLLTHTVSGPRM